MAHLVKIQSGSAKLGRSALGGGIPTLEFSLRIGMSVGVVVYIL